MERDSPVRWGQQEHWCGKGEGKERDLTEGGVGGMVLLLPGPNPAGDRIAHRLVQPRNGPPHLHRKH